MRPIDVFICYVDEDAPLRDELERHLAPLVESGRISLWHAGKLLGGANVDQEAGLHLNRAEIVLALTTANLVASPKANAMLARVRERGATFVPVLAQPSLWELSGLAGVQPLPANKQPVSTWLDREAAWVEVVHGLLATIEAHPRAT